MKNYSSRHFLEWQCWVTHMDLTPMEDAQGTSFGWTESKYPYFSGIMIDPPPFVLL